MQKCAAHKAGMAIVFVTVTVFLVGFRLLAILSFPTLAGGAWLIVRKLHRYSGMSSDRKSEYKERGQPSSVTVHTSWAKLASSPPRK